MAYENVFAALADPTRKAVFDRLRHGPLTVGALAAGLPVSRPAISQHLKALKDAGLVTIQADGVRHLYRLNGRGLEGLKNYVVTIWEEAEKAHLAEIERQLEERRYG
jgi:DNA-binding transcriptional ArsR family regulator